MSNEILISDRTFNILKELAKFKPLRESLGTANIPFNFLPGDSQCLRIRKHFFLRFKTEENFPKEFFIYDLGNFVNNLSLLKSRYIDFSDDNVAILKDGKISIEYHQTATNVLNDGLDIYTEATKYDELRKIVNDQESVEFTLKPQDVKTITRIGNLNGQEVVKFFGDDKGVFISTANNSKNSIAHNRGLVQISDEPVEKSFFVFMAIDRLQVLDLEYTVRVPVSNDDKPSKFISLFTPNDEIFYMISAKHMG